MELGLTYVRSGDHESARSWLEKVRREYSGYLLETVVHFRIHCAMRTMKLKERAEGLVPPLSRECSVEEATEATAEPASKSQSSFVELARKYQSEKSPDDGELFGL